jgi:hypothetical protein
VQISTGDSAGGLLSAWREQVLDRQPQTLNIEPKTLNHKQVLDRQPQTLNIELSTAGKGGDGVYRLPKKLHMVVREGAKDLPKEVLDVPVRPRRES